MGPVKLVERDAEVFDVLVMRAYRIPPLTMGPAMAARARPHAASTRHGRPPRDPAGRRPGHEAIPSERR